MDAISTERVIAIVAQIARERGLDTAPTVLAERSNLVLAIDSATVARVALATSITRVGMDSAAREVEITRWLDARGAPVTRPSREVGTSPIERDGLVVGFWEREELVAERPEPRSAGAALRVIHTLLRDFPRERLARWGGFEEARRVLPRLRSRDVLTPSELHRFEHAWEAAEDVVASAEGRTASFQALHGDAHIGNVLATARGPVWTDWEDAFLGPVEMDIACLRSKADLFGEERETIDAVISAYGSDYDPGLVRDLALVRNVQVIPWLAVFAEREPALRSRMQARIARLPPPTTSHG